MVDTSNVGEVVLVRHGETVGESSIRLYGATDIALSSLGERQLEAVAQALRGQVFDELIVSPLQRSRRSGDIVRAALGSQPPVEVVENFREINFGNWEGWTFAEVAERDPEGYARRQTDAEAFAFPGGESRQGFYARVAAAVTPERFATNKRTLVVVHKGIIKILLRVLCDLTDTQTRDMNVSLGSIHRLRRHEHAWKLVVANDTQHLGDELDLGG